MNNKELLHLMKDLSRHNMTKIQIYDIIIDLLKVATEEKEVREKIIRDAKEE